jgi:hypothetical protein
MYYSWIQLSSSFLCEVDLKISDALCHDNKAKSDLKNKQIVWLIFLSELEQICWIFNND